MKIKHRAYPKALGKHAAFDRYAFIFILITNFFEAFKDNIDVFSKIVVLDLCRPLIDQAAKRVQKNGWKNVELVVGDATDESLIPEGLKDYIGSATSSTSTVDSVRQRKTDKEGKTHDYIKYFNDDGSVLNISMIDPEGK